MIGESASEIAKLLNEDRNGRPPDFPPSSSEVGLRIRLYREEDWSSWLRVVYAGNDWFRFRLGEFADAEDRLRVIEQEVRVVAPLIADVLVRGG